MLLSELVMERKPIKRREELMQLSKEHHFSLLFCWKIRQGLKMNFSFDRIKKYMQYFWLQCMQPHFLEEENFLFNSVEDEKVKKALSDHRQIEVLISDAMVAEETNVSEQLSKLANLVE